MARKKKTSSLTSSEMKKLVQEAFAPQKRTSKKSRTRRGNFPPLENAVSQKQLEGLEDAASEFLKTVENTDVVPIGYMRRVFTKLSADFRQNLKSRRVDPVVRKQERIKAKISKLQEDLANTQK